MRYLILMLLLACGAAIAATEYGETIRTIELKSGPDADAASVTTLAEKTKVEILKREGAWYQVKAASGSGWLRMLAVRGEAGAEQAGEAGAKKSGDKGFSSLRNMVTGSSGSAVATGVRGLSEEDLKNAHPDPMELEKLKGMASNPTEARKFASQAKLKSQTVPYLAVTSAKDKQGKGAAK